MTLRGGSRGDGGVRRPIFPSDQLAITIFQLYLRADEPNAALANIKNLPQAQQAAALSILTQIINDKVILAKQPNNSQAKARIAANYKLLGLADIASKYSAE